MTILQAFFSVVGYLDTAISHDAGDVARWLVIGCIVVVVAFMVIRDRVVRSLRNAVTAVQQTLEEVQEELKLIKAEVKHLRATNRRHACRRAPHCKEFVRLIDDDPEKEITREA